MKKDEADLMALNLASRICDVDPQFFSASGNGTHKAEMVADFIKTLSTRLQADVDDKVHLGVTKLRQ